MKQILVKYQNIFLTLYSRFRLKMKLNSAGQSLLEYLLILALISTISYTMLDGINSKIAELWVRMITVISKDPSIVKVEDLI